MREPSREKCINRFFISDVFLLRLLFTNHASHKSVLLNPLLLIYNLFLLFLLSFLLLLLIIIVWKNHQPISLRRVNGFRHMRCVIKVKCLFVCDAQFRNRMPAFFFYKILFSRPRFRTSRFTFAQQNNDV